MNALSFIEPEERSQARRLIEDSLGFSWPALKGREIAVKLWVREEDILLGIALEERLIRDQIENKLRIMLR